MKTKLISLTLAIAAIALTGCNTTTTQSSAAMQLAAEGVTAQQLLGGKIGAQIATVERDTEIRDSDAKARLVSVDQRAYRSWKKANRS